MTDVMPAGGIDRPMPKGDKPKASARVWLKRLLRAPIVNWPLVAGTVLILCAIALEHGLWVVHAGPIKDGRGHVVGEHISTTFNWDVPILLLSEVGYALVIAWVVAIAIEASARREHNEEVKETRERIAKDVFEGVYAVRHSREYARAVVAVCLEETQVRENYSISYKVDPLPPDMAEAAGEDADDLVRVIVTARYSLRNVGPHETTYRVTYGIPFRDGPLEQFARVTMVQVGTDTLKGDRLEALARRTDDGERDYDFDVTLGSGRSEDVFVEAVIIKDRSDGDTFGFRRPTLGATIRLDVNVPDLLFGASERTASTMRSVRNPEEGRTAEWRIDGPILPYNSVSLWWRPKLPQAAAVQQDSVVEAQSQDQMEMDGEPGATG